MKKTIAVLFAASFFTIFARPVFAMPISSSVTNYVNNTLQIITIIGSLAAVFFLVKGGYLYITSSGQPELLSQAKKTIRNAIVGLVLIIGASAIVTILQNAIGTPVSNTNLSAINLSALQTNTPSNGLTQVLIDAVASFIQNVVQSAILPVTNAIFGFLTSTPTVLNNSVVFNFWTIILGITDSLFVLVVALLGLHMMSASTFGFQEVELKQLLTRIGISFLGANVSLFLVNYVILTCDALTKGVLELTGGLNSAWITSAVNPNTLAITTPLITFIFLIIFLIVAIVLLFLYISRLIVISLGAVLSPIIFLLWAIPKFSDFAEIAIKDYIVTVFIVFVHVVMIQLAASFLTIQGNSNNSLISITVGIGLLFTLLKTPSIMMQMVTYTSKNETFKKMSSQIINVIATKVVTI